MAEGSGEYGEFLPFSPVRQDPPVESDDATIEPPVAPAGPDLEAATRSSTANAQFTALGGDRAGRIVLHVSESARVTINDKATKSSGTQRLYVVQLQPGLRYRFRIVVTEGANTHRREVVMTAGETKTFRLDKADLVATR